MVQHGLFMIRSEVFYPAEVKKERIKGEEK